MMSLKGFNQLIEPAFFQNVFYIKKRPVEISSSWDFDTESTKKKGYSGSVGPNEISNIN